MPELPQARISHRLPGRLRLRIPERRGDTAFFALVFEQLSRWESIDRVEVNPVTGSVLVMFGDGPGLLAENARRNRLFTIADGLEAARTASPVLEDVRRGFDRFDQRLRKLSGGSGDARALVFFLLVAGGTYQLVRGNVAAPAATLFWYAGEALQLWRRQGANGSGDTPASPAQ